MKILLKSKDHNGKFPIKKCLNDLLGFRIISKKIDKKIESTKQKIEIMRKDDERIKLISRKKADYKGYHIYFYGQNNFCFSIEL